MYTILHISDLHRSPREPLTNATLIASLLADRDRYVCETPAVPLPDAVIVSGDIIQGAALGASGWQRDVVAQYDVAYEFLSLLADRFLEGDRSRLALVPGNHDVCWNTARSAMREVSRESEPKALPELLDPAGAFRWSWPQRQVFEIFDGDTYRRRLDAYWNFAERFYRDAALAYSFERDRGYNLFELNGGHIVLAAFESVHGTDCFSFEGAINDGTIAQCGLAIRDSRKPYLLQIATWHHSVQGPPSSTDYMDVHSVHEMIGNGFRLGLHGHQHLSEVGAHYIHLPEQQAMAVVSAGSLCAGSRDLPRGVDRQYNVLVLNDELLEARVHVREMRSGNQFGRCTKGPFGVSGSIQLTWERPADAAGRPIEPLHSHERDIVLQAESAFRRGDISSAARLLAGIPTPPGSYGRALRLEVARASQTWDAIVDALHVPSTADELVQLIEALIESDQIGQAIAALAKYSDILNLAGHIRNALEAKLAARRMLGGDQ